MIKDPDKRRFGKEICRRIPCTQCLGSLYVPWGIKAPLPGLCYHCRIGRIGYPAYRLSRS